MAAAARHVAIIGAGAVGVISAVEALREGHRVTLIDPEAITPAMTLTAIREKAQKS